MYRTHNQAKKQAIESLLWLVFIGRTNFSASQFHVNYTRSTGEVRQVGPPVPLYEIS